MWQRDEQNEESYKGYTDLRCYNYMDWCEEPPWPEQALEEGTDK